MEVIICGGGIIGTCTAYYLAKAGIRSTVLEKNELANAASGRAGGFLARDWNSGTPINELATLSYDLHCALAKELDGENQYGFRRLTTYSVSLQKSSSYSKSCHAKLPAWLDGSTIQRPSKIGDVTTNAQLHPYQFCRKLQQVCLEMGVEFMTQTEVVNIKYTPRSKLKTITISGGKELSTRNVVLAMGPWTGIAKQWFPSLPRSIYGQKAHSITVKPKTPLTPDAVFISYGESSADIYPRPDGEAFVCGIVQDPLRSENLEPPGMVNPIDGCCKDLKDLCSELSTSLKSGNVVVEQACYLPLTEDGVPIIGRVSDCDGVYVAAGHSCWGILNAPMTGKILADFIVTGKATIDISEFNPGRFAE